MWRRSAMPVAIQNDAFLTFVVRCSRYDETREAARARSGENDGQHSVRLSGVRRRIRDRRIGGGLSNNLSGLRAGSHCARGAASAGTTCSCAAAGFGCAADGIGCAADGTTSVTGGARRSRFVATAGTERRGGIPCGHSLRRSDGECAPSRAGGRRLCANSCRNDLFRDAARSVATARCRDGAGRWRLHLARARRQNRDARWAGDGASPSHAGRESGHSVSPQPHLDHRRDHLPRNCGRSLVALRLDGGGEPFGGDLFQVVDPATQQRGHVGVAVDVL